MHLLLKCLLCSVVVFPLFARGGVDPRDDASIRALVANYLSAREHKNAGELEGLFTADVDQLVSSGEWRRGRSAIVNGTLASSARTGGTRTITLTSIRLITPTVAIADGPYELTGLSGGMSRKMWSTFVLVKDSHRWRIAAIRNMLPAPAVPAAGNRR